MTETVHTTREIEALIPHRWPILLVDRIVEYDAGAQRIVGIKGVTAGEWYFQGHFPGLPVMPGVIQVEALAQTMAIYVATQPGLATGSACSRGSTRSASSGSSCPATRSASRSRWRSSAAGSARAAASPPSTARSRARAS